MATSGKSNIEVTAETRKARKTMGDFFRDIENTGRKALAVLNSIDAFGDLQRGANRTSSELDELRDSTRRLDSDLENLGDGNNLDDLSDDLNTTERNMNDVEDSTRDVDEALDDATNQMEEFGDTAVQESAAASSAVGGFWDKMKSLKGAGEIFTGIGEGMKSVGKKLSMYVTAPFVALGGLAIAKGFSRLIGIDEAKAKLDGLGHSAESVEEIMTSALDSVKGTAFGLDEAATTAANAVAAGIEKGDALTKYLSLTGDAAAIAGDSLSGMGAIFNKVQTSGKAYNGELQQLSDRGLPIYQWLAKEADVAADAVFDMATKGEISTAMFLSAIENNIGGAAQAMGAKSFKAGIDNMWAAVGRLGAKFLDAGGEGGGFFSKMKPLLGEMTENIDSLGDYAQNLGEKFGAAFSVVIEKARGVLEWFKGLSDAGKKLAGIFAGAAIAAGPVLTFLSVFVIGAGKVMTALAPLAAKVKSAGGLMKYLRTIFVAFTGPVGLTIAAIVTLGAAFITAYKKSETFREAIGNVIGFFKDLGGKIKDTIDGIKGLFKDDGQKGRDILTALGFPPTIVQALDDVAAKIAEFRHFISDFIDGIKGLFKDDGQSGRDILSSIGVSPELIAKMDNWAAKIAEFRHFVSDFIDGVKGLFKDDGQAGRDLLASLGLSSDLIARMDEWAANLSAFRGSISEFIEGFLGLFKGDGGSGRDILSDLGFTDNFINKTQSIVDTFKTIGGVIKDVFVSAMPVVKSAVLAVVDFLGSSFKKVVDFFKSDGAQMIEAVKVIFDRLLKHFKFLGLIIGVILTGIFKVIQFVMPGILWLIKSVWGNIKGIITGALDIIMGAIKIFTGIFTGDFKKMWEGVKQLFSGAVKFLFNLIALTFFGRLLTGVKIFIAVFAGVFIRLKDAIIDVFVLMVEGAKAKWELLKSVTAIAIKALKDIALKIFTLLVKDIIAKWELLKTLITIAVTAIRDVVSKIFTSVSNRIKAIFNGIQKFMSFIWSAIYNAIAPVVSSIWNFVKPIFEGMWALVKSVFGGILKVISTIWSAISQVFVNVGAAIFGIAKELWDKFYNYTSNKFNAVRKYIADIWNKISAVFLAALGVIIKTVRDKWNETSDVTSAKFTAIKDFFGRVWSNIKKIFVDTINGILNFLRPAWDAVSSKTSTVFNAIKDFLSRIWTTIRNTISGLIDAILTKIRTIWDAVSSKTTAVFNAVRDFLSRIWSNIRDTVVRIVTVLSDRLSSAWDSILTKTKSVFKNVFDAIKGRFDDIVDAAKKLPQRIGDGLKNMASNVSSGINSLVNKMADGLEKGVNGVIGGINKVLAKLGVETKIAEISIPRYAKGTKGDGKHPGGPMVVGDGTGSNAGPELIKLPNGKQMLSPSKPTLMDGPEGTQVWSATETRKILAQIPHYALGDKVRKAKDWLGENVMDPAVKLGGKAVSGAKKVGSKVNDWAVDVFEYIKDPGKLLDLALKTLGVVKPKEDSFSGALAAGGWNKVKSGAVDFIKGKLADFGDQKGQGFGSAFRKTSSYGNRINPITVLPETHWGDDYAAKQGTLIRAQAAGQAIQSAYHALRGNYVRIKSGIMERIYQHNQRNLVGVGDTVSKGQAIGTVGSTGRSTGPHLHYEVLKNGKHINPAGYFRGAIVKAKQLAWVAEKGMEAIIPMETNRAEGLDLWRRVGEHFGFNMDALLNPAAHEVNFAGAGMGGVPDLSPTGAGRRLGQMFTPSNAQADKIEVIIQPGTVNVDGQHLTDIIFEHVDTRFVNQSQTEDMFKGRTK